LIDVIFFASKDRLYVISLSAKPFRQFSGTNYLISF